MEPVKVVVRYVDGRMVKGYSHDFFPNKPAFHVGSGPSDSGDEVHVNQLKAVFFVKDFQGNPAYDESKEFGGRQATGRKVEVTFTDGEVLTGTTLGYDPKRQGFFLIPPDPDSNNLRVFVVSGAVVNFRFL